MKKELWLLFYSSTSKEAAKEKYQSRNCVTKNERKELNRQNYWNAAENLEVLVTRPFSQWRANRMCALRID